MGVLVSQNKSRDGYNVHHSGDLKFDGDKLVILPIKEFKELIHSKKQNIIIAPEDLSENSSSLIVCTESELPIFKEILPDITNRIVTLKEKINNRGSIEFDIEESEVNKMLRQIFQKAPNLIYICLTNSVQNPSHEKIIKNIVKGVGYKVKSSFFDFD